MLLLFGVLTYVLVDESSFESLLVFLAQYVLFSFLDGIDSSCSLHSNVWFDDILQKQYKPRNPTVHCKTGAVHFIAARDCLQLSTWATPPC